MTPIQTTTSKFKLSRSTRVDTDQFSYENTSKKLRHEERKRNPVFDEDVDRCSTLSILNNKQLQGRQRRIVDVIHFTAEEIEKYPQLMIPDF